MAQRERQRQTETETETKRQRQREKQRERERDRETERERQRETVLGPWSAELALQAPTQARELEIRKRLKIRLTF